MTSHVALKCSKLKQIVWLLFKNKVFIFIFILHCKRLQGNDEHREKTVSVTENVGAMNRVVTVFCFMVQGMTVGITGNDCLHNRGPTGGQWNTVKNCVHYRELVCSELLVGDLGKIPSFY